VEQSCHKCGTKFEEGAAFCPQCNAPQIRVAIGEGLAAEPAPIYHLASGPGSGIEWSQGFPAAALAGFAGSVVMLFPFATTLGPVVLAAAGFLAVVLYRRRRPLSQLGPGIGAVLGTLSGTLGFGFLAIPLAVSVTVSHSWEQIHREVLEAVKDAASRSPSPQAQQMVEFCNTPTGFALLIAGSLVLFLLFAGVGGAIGGAVLRWRNKPPEIGRF